MLKPIPFLLGSSLMFACTSNIRSGDDDPYVPDDSEDSSDDEWAVTPDEDGGDDDADGGDDDADGGDDDADGGDDDADGGDDDADGGDDDADGGDDDADGGDDDADGGDDDADGGDDDADGGDDDADGGDYPLDGFGDISGDCNAITLPGDAGLFLQNTIDFGTNSFDETLLSHGGAELLEEGTLGGSSIHSEIFAFEVLHRCEVAFLLKSETEIEYVDIGGKKTDMLVEIDGQNVGVSVTRAYKWGEGAVYTEEDAFLLLSDKLSDVLESAENVAEADAWNHAILHVITYDESYLTSLEAAYSTLPGELKDEVIVVLTVTAGDDEFIY
jgi:hypothetical protein